MAYDFTSWEGLIRPDELMHYGIPGMRKGFHIAKKAKPQIHPKINYKEVHQYRDFLKNRQNQRKATKERIDKIQASNRRELAFRSMIGMRSTPGIRNDELGGYEKDVKFKEKHGIKGAYATKDGRITTEKPKVTLADLLNVKRSAFSSKKPKVRR